MQPAQPTWDVLAVRYGTLRTPRSRLYYRYESYGEPDAEQQMDYYFWVLRDGDRHIVVDTGFQPEVGERRGRTCLLSPGEALARLDVDPAAVSQVVISHLHYDHIGNLDLFGNAEFVVAEAEWEFWTSKWARHHQFWEHVESEEIAQVERAHRDGRLRLLPGRTELAPGLTVIPVGGHSPGQQIVYVDGGNGPVILTSDAVHLYDELDRDRPFSVLADLAGMYQAFELIRQLAAESGAAVVAGHDPDVMGRFPAIDGDAGAFTAQVG